MIDERLEVGGGRFVVLTPWARLGAGPGVKAQLQVQ